MSSSGWREDKEDEEEGEKGEEWKDILVDFSVEIKLNKDLNKKDH